MMIVYCFPLILELAKETVCAKDWKEEEKNRYNQQFNSHKMSDREEKRSNKINLMTMFVPLGA